MFVPSTSGTANASTTSRELPPPHLGHRDKLAVCEIQDLPPARSSQTPSPTSTREIVSRGHSHRLLDHAGPKPLSWQRRAANSHPITRAATLRTQAQDPQALQLRHSAPLSCNSGSCSFCRRRVDKSRSSVLSMFKRSCKIAAPNVIAACGKRRKQCFIFNRKVALCLIENLDHANDLTLGYAWARRALTSYGSL